MLYFSATHIFVKLCNIAILPENWYGNYQRKSIKILLQSGNIAPQPYKLGAVMERTSYRYCIAIAVYSNIYTKMDRVPAPLVRARTLLLSYPTSSNNNDNNVCTEI